jgi:hypothetical protein
VTSWQSPTAEQRVPESSEAARVVSSRLVYAESRAALALAHCMDRIDDVAGAPRSKISESVHQQLDVIEVTGRLVRQ